MPEKIGMSRGHGLLDDTCKRFNRLPWHDSKLIGVKLLRSGDGLTDEVHLAIRLLSDPRPGHYRWQDVDLALKDCTIIKLDLDLSGKRLCADDISEAFCAVESELKTQIERELKYEQEPLAQFLHFRISMIPPGGSIDIFARHFELVEKGADNR